jgi:hypothetical protein
MPVSVLTVPAAITAFNNSTLAAGTIISDTAFNVAANIDALHPVAASGLVTSITFTSPATANFAITAAQQAADSAVIALIASPALLGLRITAAQAATTASVPSGFLSAVVSDSAANIQANIAGIQSLYSRGLLGTVFVTDAGTPTISLSAATVAANVAALSRLSKPYNLVLTDPGTPTLTLPNWAVGTSFYPNVVGRITTPFNLAFAGVTRISNILSAELGVTRFTSSYLRGQAVDPIAPLGVIYTNLIPTGLKDLEYVGNIATFLESLQIVAAAGKLVSVTSQSGGVQVLAITAAQYTANPLAIAKLTPNFQFSQIITAAQAAGTPSLDPRFAIFAVQDSRANILANITAIDALFRTGRANFVIVPDGAPDFVMTAAQFGQAALTLSYYGDRNRTITLTDGGTPTVTISADLLALAILRNGALLSVTTPYHLAITGAISASLAAKIVSENTVVLSRLTGLTVSDTASAIAANIGALNTLVALGAIASITLDPTAGIPQLGLTSGQQTTNASVLAKIVGPYVAGSTTGSATAISAANFLASLGMLEAGVQAGTQAAISLTDGGVPTLLVSAAILLANLDAFGKLTGNYVIALTDGGTPNLALTQAQTSAGNLAALSHIQGGFTFSVPGVQSLSVANALVSNSLQSRLSAPLNVALDYYGLGAALGTLQALATAGSLGAVTNSNATIFGPPPTWLTAAQATASAGVLAAIASPHTYELIVNAAQAASTTIPQGIFQLLFVSDTAANIVANLASLEPLAANGRISNLSNTDSGAISLTAAQVSANYDALAVMYGASITLSDGGTPTIEIQDWQFSNTGLLNRITSPFALQIDGPVRANIAATLNSSIYGSRLVAGSLTIRDGSGSIPSRVDAISALYAAGKVADIEIRDFLPIMSMTTGQLTTLNSFAAAISTPFVASQIISVATALASPTLAAGFANFTISDSVANILANIAGLETLAKTGVIGAVSFTDAVPRIVTSAAVLSNNAEFWGRLGGAYPIVLTDPGTPVISVNAAQLNVNFRNEVLECIAGPYQLQITGLVSAGTAAAIVSEFNSVLTSLTGTTTISDFSYNIAASYDQLEYLARQGKLESVTLLDPGGTINVAPFQAAADTAIGPLIVGSFTLAQTAPCFLAGTRINTLRGEVAVEDLIAGDRAVTASGASRPIVWIGHRTLLTARHPRPQDVHPVRVQAHAFARGQPARDLWLSPDHALFVGGALIPVRYLLNGATISQIPRDQVQYFHVELDAHDILLAEALPTESFLDTGNRGAFANGGGTVMAQPDFALRIWATDACAPLAVAGPLVETIRCRLLDRALHVGHEMTDDPGLVLVVDGVVLRPDWVDSVYGFALPAKFETIRLHSRAFVPAEMLPGDTDHRRLGVAVTGLWIDGRPAILLPPGNGWYEAEPHGQWTDGDAVIPCADACLLEIRIACAGPYWLTADAEPTRRFG